MKREKKWDEPCGTYRRVTSLQGTQEVLLGTMSRQWIKQEPWKETVSKPLTKARGTPENDQTQCREEKPSPSSGGKKWGIEIRATQRESGVFMSHLPKCMN